MISPYIQRSTQFLQLSHALDVGTDVANFAHAQLLHGFPGAGDPKCKGALATRTLPEMARNNSGSWIIYLIHLALYIIYTIISFSIYITLYNYYTILHMFIYI